MSNDRVQRAVDSLVEQVIQKSRADDEEGTLVRRDRIHDLLMKCTRIIRATEHSLGARFGSEAQRVLTDALDTCEELLESM